LARQRSTIQRTGVGAFGAACERGSGSSRMIATSVSAPVFLWKARLPAAISYRIDPTENWSERKSTGWPLACSGDM
jgi:hypothetical protein